jgi:hypothetical protein
MTEYLIAFNDEWVPDHTVEELREKSKAGRALVAGVFIFTGGLDDAAPVFSVDASSGCGRERSRWPAVGRRRCDVSGSPCNFRRFLNGVGGRSCREALLRVLVDTTSSTSRRTRSGTAATPTPACASSRPPDA